MLYRYFILSFIFGTSTICNSQEGLVEVVMLGTGTPFADPEKSGPSVAVVVNDVPYLFDCGPGVVRRASAAYSLGVEGLEISKLDKVFITHLHSDHTVGLSDIFLTPAVLGRSKSLSVYGPKGVISMTENILLAYQEDISVRVNGLEKGNKEAYEMTAIEIDSVWIYKDENVEIRAFNVNHGSWLNSYGYRIQTSSGKIIVVSGDCTYSESIIENCRGCDVLVHEVYSKEGLAQRPEQWQIYHSSFHTSSEQLARIATIAKPKVLILTHQLVWGSTEDKLLGEVKSQYSGNIINGKDLQIIKVN